MRKFLAKTAPLSRPADKGWLSWATLGEPAEALEQAPAQGPLQAPVAAYSALFPGAAVLVVEAAAWWSLPPTCTQTPWRLPWSAPAVSTPPRSAWRLTSDRQTLARSCRRGRTRPSALSVVQEAFPKT